MPNPRKRHSLSRKNMRRSHDALKVVSGSICPQCREQKPPHRICPHCGTYKGREVVSSQE
ncbi:MAG: 50S ribosomal protein L32 [Deltaproteobacteria bacterium]|nr:50S ribosomal protein L32 [Deltaproteobacteria bacterium]